MSSGEAEYIAPVVVCMQASHICLITYDLRNLGSPSYDSNEPKCEASRIIIDNEAAIAIWLSAIRIHVKKFYIYEIS